MDKLGPFVAEQFTWSGGGGACPGFVTTVRDYTANGLPAVVFEQSFPQAMNISALTYVGARAHTLLLLFRVLTV